MKPSSLRGLRCHPQKWQGWDSDPSPRLQTAASGWVRLLRDDGKAQLSLRTWLFASEGWESCCWSHFLAPPLDKPWNQFPILYHLCWKDLDRLCLPGHILANAHIFFQETIKQTVFRAGTQLISQLQSQPQHRVKGQLSGHWHNLNNLNSGWLRQLSVWLSVLAQVMISRFMSWSPMLGSMLTVQTLLEIHILSLSLSLKINKL